MHISEGKQKICTVDITDTTINYRFQITNHLGSSSIELDDLGNIISYEEYHPFGTTSYRSGRNEAEVSLKRYKYVMKELDNETGLYYYGMRFYAPWLARFVSSDPLQVKYPIYTPYQYAGNMPITFIDLDGAEPMFPGIYNSQIFSDNSGQDYIWSKEAQSWSNLLPEVEVQYGGWTIEKTKEENGDNNVNLDFRAALLITVQDTSINPEYLKYYLETDLENAFSTTLNKTIYEQKNLLAGLDRSPVNLLIPIDTVKTNVNINTDVRIINNFSEHKYNEMLIEVLPQNQFDKKTVGGSAYYNGNYFMISQSGAYAILGLHGTESARKVIPHEAGHTLGLFHPDEDTQLFGFIKGEQYLDSLKNGNNLMFGQGKDKGIELTQKQIDIIIRNYDTGELNKNTIKYRK